MSAWLNSRVGPSHRLSPDESATSSQERDRSPLRSERVDLYRTNEVLEYYSGYPEGYNAEDYNYTWPESYRPDDSRRDELYQQFYKEIEDDYSKEKYADCVVIALSKQQGDYAKLVGRRVQELGLLVDLMYLKLELALEAALKDVKEEGSPFCVVISAEHQTLSSCTVIILCGGHKEHRNMPLDDALDLISREHKRVYGEQQEKERLEIAYKAASLADDYLHREYYEETHIVPSNIRHLLFLLGDGKHLYPEEMQKIAEYLGQRKEQYEAGAAAAAAAAAAAQATVAAENYYDQGAVSQCSSKPKPLLPTPSRPPLLGQAPLTQKKAPLLGDRPIRALLPVPTHLKLGTRPQPQ
ncbi:nuclear receptor coactivator 5 [Callorhinchus milii]|uniref:Nuclear receptor coactivator 5-like n=1 Tax=Callorhinchus milii TaxID=7868 RepID=V9KMK2_CALMI|nr:nuclear receptor coactivator 5 [Callorhinchus milii]|eukprot:gi/632944656/ref/XP_007887624.1/ PREDICTED: nuclear receptor coactivator 5-like [Callorhinchus milii]